MTSTDLQPPREPICQSAENDREPCRFASQCNERRQRVMHYARPPIRGEACWKYQQLVARPNPTATIDDPDAQLERAAIQAEG